MLNLRGDADDPRFAQAVLDATGLHLPRKPNTASIDPQRQLLWLGPDEWLLKLRDRQGDGRGGRAAGGVAAACTAPWSTSGMATPPCCCRARAAPTCWRAAARWTCIRASSRTGALAQTHIAKASATVLCLYAGIQYEITVRRSFADYLVRWLCEAGA